MRFALRSLEEGFPELQQLGMPLCPAMVNGYEFAGRLGAALTVSVDVEFVVEGTNVAVAPAGRPVAERSTDPLKPPLGETVTV